ncbi:hypothetical protein GVY41_15530 [Frigidibacter albus]|uniref:Uncharacterized protein n=1 Tax=Frigidibacter albus TaxID=1465486 RepID=A0A6L8VJB6_9RHOB|nr:hypothetical protein [Frigidibacter albus]MZQ90468.1 hypothetical protein [Frigidibacter albus]NBE32412.1 hypothetical protein [Frigidibacter albus]GGH59635.1 hypothetical protein GCM10011341_31110 [Frigidibacter albus]
MTTRATPPGKLRQAALAWTVMVSLLLVWAASGQRAADIPVRSAVASLAEARGQDHVATPVAIGKAHRPADVRSGPEPDLLALLAEAPVLANGPKADEPSCPQAALRCLQPRHRHEPRAPPLT